MLKNLWEFLYKIKTYWKKPPKGYDVGYGEYFNLAMGYGGISFLSILVQWTGIATTTYMMISYFKLSTGVAFFLNTFLGSVIALVRAPILSMLIDNSNDKKGRGKFKRFLMWSSIGTGLCMGLIPFIPDAWNKIELFEITIPKIPIMGIYEPSQAKFTLAVVVLFVMSQAGTFFYTLLNQAMGGVEQTISTVAQERANIASIRSILGNLPGSVVNILFPVLAGLFFANSGHQLNINLYRLVFPLSMIGGVLCMLFVIKGTNERVVVNRKYVARVKFFEGAKELSKNKYFWVITIFNTIVGIRGMANITGWICQFSFQSNTAKTFSNLFCTTILMNVILIGTITGPLLIKKFGKRNVLLFSNIGFAVMIVFQLLVYRNPYLVLFSTLLQNIFSGYGFISVVMASDILDYQQWKTGKRLEGFWSNYSGFIGTILGIFTGMLMPLFLSFAGIGFGDDINTALVNTALRDNAYRYLTLLGLIGAVICVIPMFFYDLTEKKHANYVRALKLRAAADNFEAGDLQDQDILNYQEIVAYANEANDAFVLDELSRHSCTQAILAQYDEANARREATQRQEAIKEFDSAIDLEEKRVQSKLVKLLEKAERKGEPFDQMETRKQLMLKTRHLKYFAEGALAKYQTAEEISRNLDEIYPMIEAIQEKETATV